MKVRIEIDTKTFVRFWLVVLAFAAAILAIFAARQSLILVGISFFLALALSRPVSYLAEKMPGKSRTGGTAVAFLLVILILGTVITLVVPPIAEQTSKLATAVPSLIDQASSQNSGLRDIINQYNLQPQIDSAIGSLKEKTAGIAGNVGQALVSGLSSFAAFITALIIVLVMTYLMLVEGPTWVNRIWSLYNPKNRVVMEHHKHTVARMYNVVTSYVVGQITVSGIGALCSGAMVFLLSFFFKIPANLALPTIAIAFLLSLIPMFGATIGGIIITLMLLINDVGAAISFVIFFVIYQQFENNVVSPTIQSKRIELSALAILVAVTIGTYTFGIAGGIISIPVAGCIKVLIEEYMVHVRRVRAEGRKRNLTNFLKRAIEDEKA